LGLKKPFFNKGEEKRAPLIFSTRGCSVGETPQGKDGIVHGPKGKGQNEEKKNQNRKKKKTTENEIGQNQTCKDD